MQVLNVTARDPDEGLNGQVVYELKQRDPVTALFYINELSKARKILCLTVLI